MENKKTVKYDKVNIDKCMKIITLKANLQHKMKYYIFNTSLVEIGLFHDFLDILKLKYDDYVSHKLIYEGIISNINNFTISKDKIIHNFYNLFIVPCKNVNIMIDLLLFLDIQKNISLEERIEEIEYLLIK